MVFACGAAGERTDGQTSTTADDSGQPVEDGGSQTTQGDGGTATPESCGEVIFTDLDGMETSYTQAFTDGQETLLSTDGTLAFCTGTWFVVLSVQAEVTVLGLGEDPSQTVLSGGGWGTVVEVSGSGAAVVVENLTLDRGSARGKGNDQAGGGLRCTDGAHAQLRSVILSNNQAYDGGGLYGNQGCTVDVDGAVFRDNLSTDDGGAFRVDDSIATVRNSTFEGSAARDGGGLFAWDSDVTLDGVDFVDNHSTDSQGGAVLHYFGSLTVRESSFVDNGSLQVGGALSLFGDTTLDDVRFEGNASNDGGAIFLYTADGALTCTGCGFDDNSPDDIALDIGGSYQLGSDADFRCDGSGCG